MLLFDECLSWPGLLTGCLFKLLLLRIGCVFRMLLLIMLIMRYRKNFLGLAIGSLHGLESIVIHSDLDSPI